MSPKRLYNFRIDPELDEGLKLVKERDGIAESEQIRRALRAWLEERGGLAKKKAERKRAVTRKRP